MTTNAPPAKAKRERKPVKPQWLDRDRLCGARKNAGLTPEETAAKAGTSRRSYDHWEAGDWGCDLGTVVSLAAALDCQPADLMHDEGREAFAKLTAALSAA